MKYIALKLNSFIALILTVLLTLGPSGQFISVDTAYASTSNLVSHAYNSRAISKPSSISRDTLTITPNQIPPEYNPQGLSPTSWTITDEFTKSQVCTLGACKGNLVSTLTDNNPATYAQIASNPATGASGFVIDLGATTVVDRVYLTGPTTGEGQSSKDGSPANWSGNGLPLGMIRVYVGDTKPTTPNAEFMVPYDAGNPVDTEADLRFQPVAGSHVWVEFQTANIRWNNYQGVGNPANWPSTPTTAANMPWNTAEVEVHGFAEQSSINPKDAVVLSDYVVSALAAYTPWSPSTNSNSTAANYLLYLPLITAANDLSYYLGKLTGNPVPIISANQVSSFTGKGTLYTINDLQSIAIKGSSVSSYANMITNENNGTLPSDISVTQSGNTIQFSGWPYRNVEKSVWVFLAKLGVHWVYPTPHGDYIPVIGPINWTSSPPIQLPLNGVSVSLPGATSPKTVQSNWGMPSSQPWGASIVGLTRQGYLNYWRSGWNSTENAVDVIGGSEIPKPLASSKTLSSTLPNDYSTGFSGYPGNFGWYQWNGVGQGGVIPVDVLDANPDWCGYDSVSGQRICTPESDSLLPSTWANYVSMAFDMSNPNVINWVSNKLIAVDAYAPKDTSGTSISFINQWYGLLPLDISGFDQGTKSQQLNSSSPTSIVPIPNPISYTLYPNNSQTGAYFNFINQVATQVANDYKTNKLGSPPIIGALAYSDWFLPPPSWLVSQLAQNSQLASNLNVQVCQYGAWNLPISTAVSSNLSNYAMKQVLDQWGDIAKQAGSLLSDYEWTLYTEGSIYLPVPAVDGIVDRAQYLANMKALDGNSQGTPASYPYNPWNFYAYARIRQDTTLTANQIENEFFTSYFKEAAVPMLAYYQTMENWQVQNDINLHPSGTALYAPTIGSYPNSILAQMQNYLGQAQSAAKSWIVQKRVADMAKELNWIIAQRNLTGVNLSDTSATSYGSVGGVLNQGYTLDLTKGIASNFYPYSSGGNGSLVQAPGYAIDPSNIKGSYTAIQWDFQSAGKIYEPLNFVQGGSYTVNIVAAGLPQAGIAPIMDLYVGPKLIGSLTIPKTGLGSYQPYTFTANIPDGLGVQDFLISSPNAHQAARIILVYSITITRTGPSTLPTVSLTTDNNLYTAGSTVNLTATASAVTGAKITSITFYNGTTPLGTVTNSTPLNSNTYPFAWEAVPAGNYSLTAVATDSNGANSTSSVQSIVVGNALNVLITNNGGYGEVFSADNKIHCGVNTTPPNVCTEIVSERTTVTLTANVSSGSTFSGWSDTANLCSGSGSCTVSASDTVTATFSPQILAPSITTQPTTEKVNVGRSGVFSVVATGTAPLVYQWYKNGIAVVGATNSSYKTPVITSENSGDSYAVKVSNSAGSQTSSAAILMVDMRHQIQLKRQVFKGVAI